MKTFIKLIVMLLFVSSCNSSHSVAEANQEANIPEEDIVKLESDALEYEIIIIEPGFNYWLASMAQPEGYYSQSYLEYPILLKILPANLERQHPKIYQYTEAILVFAHIVYVLL